MVFIIHCGNLGLFVRVYHEAQKDQDQNNWLLQLAKATSLSATG